jgi:hypothetical protein
MDGMGYVLVAACCLLVLDAVSWSCGLVLVLVLALALGAATWVPQGPRHRSPETCGL